MASWQAIARENLKLARTAVETSGGERTACSRAYYAAFSGLTAYLGGTVAMFLSGQITPAHRQVRSLVSQYGDPSWRQEVEVLFFNLYAIRIVADYRSDREVRPIDAQLAIGNARRIIHRLGVG